LVVSNTTPLIYLAALGDFALLRDLFAEIVIPAAVLQEITDVGGDLRVVQAVRAAMGSWLCVQEIRGALDAERLRKAGLHAGENEAIVPAAELQAEALLMDDSDGVQTAAARRLNVIRTPGIYGLAKQRGIIPAVRPKLDDLRNAGF
jgi:predicted nucleic acid-binding protein